MLFGLFPGGAHNAPFHLLLPISSCPPKADLRLRSLLGFGAGQFAPTAELREMNSGRSEQSRRKVPSGLEAWDSMNITKAWKKSFPLISPGRMPSGHLGCWKDPAYFRDGGLSWGWGTNMAEPLFVQITGTQWCRRELEQPGPSATTSVLFRFKKGT